MSHAGSISLRVTPVPFSLFVYEHMALIFPNMVFPGSLGPGNPNLRHCASANPGNGYVTLCDATDATALQAKGPLLRSLQTN